MSTLPAAAGHPADPGAPPPPPGGFRAFMVAWLPSLLVVIATGGCLFSLSWWINGAPGGGASLGLVIGGSSVVSLTVTTVLSGVLDRADRLRALTVLLLVLALPVAALVVLFGGTGHGTAALIAAAVCYTAISTTETLYLAATETVTADLAPASWPETRTALLTQIHSQVDRVVAPAAAGAVIAAGALRSVPVTALAVLLAMLLVLRWGRRPLDAVTARLRAEADPAAPAAGNPLRTWLRDAASAVALIRAHRDLVFLVRLGVLGNLIVFPFYAVLPAFLTAYVSSPRENATVYGQAAAAYGLGMLVGTVVLLRAGRRLSGRRALAVASGALAAICGVVLAVSLTTSPGAVVAGLTLTGLLFSVLVAVGGAVWLRRTPAEIRVRVFSLRRLTVFSSIPVGTALLGVGGAAFGYREFVRGVVLVVLVALAWSWLAARRHLTDDAPA
ncbi:hypothetical protein ABZ135_25090 [Streptomyces sp. NPDC006339]|uniref:hypothetical protein n=1 Tax=Streptomyces sp. NPDC006339 TaxID=3156755 RepID=UPI0033A374B6